MIRNIYAVLDARAGIYSAPFLSINDAVAIRALEQAATDPNCDISKSPLDYFLQLLGTFDDESGRFNILEAPKPIAHALQLLVNPDQE